MARPAKVTGTVFREIAKIRQSHPKWKPSEIQGELRSFVLDECKKEHPSWTDERIKEFVEKKRLPGESIIQKTIMELDKQMPVPDPPWSLGDLVEHPIPPEALSIVLKISTERKASPGSMLPLTTRQAQWIGRLYTIVRPPLFKFDNDIWYWAVLYSQEEWLSEIAGEVFDTTILDSTLVSDPTFARLKMRKLWLAEIAEKYNADPVELEHLNLSREGTEEAAKSGRYPDVKGLLKVTEEFAKAQMEALNERKHNKKKA
jgi:hypothetical protein